MKYLLSLTLLLSPVVAAETKEPVRDLCNDVAYELNIAVEMKLITSEARDRINSRCIKLYETNPQSTNSTSG
jgi:hypothetical protein